MALLYLIPNHAANITAAPTPVATGSATLKTLLQFKPLVPCKVIEWGISFDGSAAATPGTVELIETDVAATVTAHVNAGITQSNGDAVQFGDPTATLISVGVSATGYTASAEGTITAVRNIAPPQQIAPTTQYQIQLPLGRDPFVQANKFLRVRTKFAAGVNALCYVIVEF